MNQTLVAAVLAVGLVGLVVYAFRHFIVTRRRSAHFDAGTVSQSWLTEHRAAKHDDRFS
jgi:hypothetical protein